MGSYTLEKVTGKKFKIAVDGISQTSGTTVNDLQKKFMPAANAMT
jgi:hypothetical protein